MAFDAGTLVGTLKADIQNFKKGLQDVKTEAKSMAEKVKAGVEGMNKSIEKWTPQLQKASLALAGISAGGTLLIKDMVGAASDAAETLNKTSVVFGEHAQKVIDASEGAAQAVGASRQQYQAMASDVGNLLGPMGFLQDESASLSMDMVQLAADVGSFNNAETPEVLEAIKAGLIGSSEPLRKYGVQLSVARIQQEAVNMGLSDGKGELSNYAKAQATLSLIMKDTAAAQGDFANTSDGLANGTKILKAQFDDLKTGIGNALLPVFTQLVGIGRTVLEWFQGLSPEVQKFIAFALLGTTVVAGLLAPFLLFITLIPSLIAGFGAVAGALTVLTGPIGIAIALVAALALAWSTNFLGIRDIVGGFVSYLSDTFEWMGMVFSDWSIAVGEVLTALAPVFQLFWEQLGLYFQLFVALLTGDWKKAWDTAKQLFANFTDGIMLAGQALWTGLQGLFGIGKDLVVGVWKSMLDGMKGAVLGAFEFIKNSIKDGINWMIQKLNAFIGAINSVAKYVPGLSRGEKQPKLLNNIPYLATGGIVTGPTLAMIGEAGPEAVIPLDRLGGMGGGTHFHFHDSVISSKEAAMELMDAAFADMRPRMGV